MPASSASSGRPGRDRSRQPAVPQPRGALQESLEQDGISWEGSILIIGQDGDIPAWLTVTAERLVLSRGESILLEAPRSWLVPAPLRVHDQQVRLSITPEGVVPGRATTERLLLDIQKGRGPAQQLVAILTGRSRREQLNAEFPTWNTGVGAGPTLPPLPAFESTQDAEPARTRQTADTESRGRTPIDAWGADELEPQPAKPAIPYRAPEEEPVEPQSHAARYLAGRDHGAMWSAREEPAAEATRPANVTSIEEERERRRAGWGIWAGRVAMVLIVALVGSWFARDYLPAQVTERLPAFVDVDRDGSLGEGDGQPPSSDARNGDGTLGANTDPEDIMPTEAALGLGGTTSEVPDPALETEAAGEQPTPTPAPQAGTGQGSDPAGESQEGERPNESSDAGNPAAVVPQDDTSTSAQQNTDDTADGDGEGAAEDPIAPTVAPAEPTVAPVQTTEVPVEPTEVPVQPTVAPTEVAVEPTQEPEPTTTPTEVPVEPTEVPVEPTIAPTEEPEPTVAPTEAPTEPPVPTEEPEPTIAPTDVPVEPTEAPVEPTEEATEPALESQPPSVTESEPPTQQFATEGIRYSIEGVSTGASLPELPEINEVSYGEWIVLAVEGENWTESEQIFDMREFTLIADGQPIQLDVGNSWVASLLGYMPAYGNTDATLWAAGESHPFVLTFLAPRDAESLVLQAGDQRFDLRTLIEQSPPLDEMREGEAPEAIEATVVEVIDGETIVIEKDGVRQTVRYLGIDAPGDGDCNDEASTALNRELVEGRTVRIERQATDVDAQGNWVRDIWVEQEDGRFALVSHLLVEQGAAEADISEPNTRFASWLRGAEAMAQAEGRGLWGACEQGSGSSSAPVAGDVVMVADQRRSA